MRQHRDMTHALSRYAGTSNLERSQRIMDSATEHRQVSDCPPGLTVIVLDLDKPELLLPLLDRMEQVAEAFQELNLGFEVVVGDTGSNDPEVLKRYEIGAPWLKVLRNLSYHFSRNNNECWKAADKYQRILLLNNNFGGLVCFLQKMILQESIHRLHLLIFE